MATIIFSVILATYLVTIMGSSSQPQTQTQSVSAPDPAIQATTREIMGSSDKGTGLLGYAMPNGQFMHYPGADAAADTTAGNQLVAPLTPFAGAALNTVADMPGYEQNYGNAQSLAQTPNYFNGTTGVDQTHVGPFNAQTLAQFSDPYTKSVVDAGEAQMQQANALTMQMQAKQAADAGAFGGTRQAVQNSLDNNQFAMANNQFLADTLSKSYGAGVGAYNNAVSNNLADYNAKLAANQANTANEAQAYNQQLGLAGQGDQLAAQKAQIYQGANALLQGQNQNVMSQGYQQRQNEAQYPISLAGQLAAINQGNVATLPVSSSGTSTQSGGPSKGSQLLGTGVSAGGNALSGGGLGSLLAWSDGDIKKDISFADGEDILDRLSDVPVHHWRYQEGAQATHGLDDAEHTGPMAQDMADAFDEDAPEVAPGVKGIDVVSMLGRLTAAVKALDARTR